MERPPATAAIGVVFGNNARIPGGVHIGNLTLQSVSAASPRSTPVPQQAPPLPSHHTVRRSIRERIWTRIGALSRTSPSSLPLIALHGLGGIGKSTLAAELASSEDAHAMFPDGVLWATLGSQPQIQTLLGSWVHGMGERPTEAWSEATAVAYLRSVLRARKVMLIVDDAWREEHVRPFLVGGPKCCVILTTRRAIVADGVGAATIPVAELEPDESVRLMAQRAGRGHVLEPGEEREARLLTYQLGHLPLAIELVGALVARRYTWIEARTQLIAFEGTLPEDVKAKPHPRRKLEACFGLSLSVLRDESPELWKAFCLCALIPHGQDITARMASTLWDVTEEQAGRWLHALDDDALLRRSSGGYVLHSLLHATAERLFRAGTPEGLGTSLRDGHRALVCRYRTGATSGGLTEVLDDGYIVDRWAWHLVQADEVDGLFELLSANDRDGKNRWYQRRSEGVHAAGYLDDLRLARNAALQSCNRSRQIFVALCQSSVLSLTSSYSGDVIFGLVRRGLWTPAWAFQWAREVCNVDTRVDCLLGLCRAAQLLPSPGDQVDLELVSAPV